MSRRSRSQAWMLHGEVDGSPGSAVMVTSTTPLAGSPA